MSDETITEIERLRRTLLDGDPARDGRTPDPAEIDRMRRRVLTAAESVPSMTGAPAYALAAAAVVLLTAALGWGLWRDGSAGPDPVLRPRPGVQRVIESSLGGMQSGRDVRRIQFRTPGGTRVVWTLDPDFEV